MRFSHMHVTSNIKHAQQTHMHVTSNIKHAQQRKWKQIRKI